MCGSRLGINILTIFLCYTVTNLCACPLPRNVNTSSVPCHQCDVIKYIDRVHGSHSINLVLNVTLGKTINNAEKFVNNIESNSDFFFIARNVSNSANCFGNPSNGSTCTQQVEMFKQNQNLICSWNYTCDYAPNRFPQFIWKAQCPDSLPGYNVHPVYYQMPVLNYTSRGSNNDDCVPFKNPGVTYTWDMISVPVACTCVAMR